MRRYFGLLLCLTLLCPAIGIAESETEALFAWTLEIGSHKQTNPTAMAMASQGGVFIVGNTTSEQSGFGEPLGETDAFVLYISADGALKWQKRLGGSAEDTLTAVAALPDGGCVAIGSSTSMDGDLSAARGGADAWLVRLSRQGELLYSKSLGGSLDDELVFLTVTEEGQYFVCGRTQSRNEDLRANHGGWDAWAMLLAAEDGKPVWALSSYRYGNEGDDIFTQARPTSNGWMLLGEMEEEISRTAEDEPVYRARPIVQRIDTNGEALWEEASMLGDTGDNTLHAMLETDTGWLLAGETNSRSSFMPTSHGGKDIWLLQMRQSGSVSWQRSYGGSREDKLHSVTPLPGGGYLLLGETLSTDGQVFGAHGSGGDVWLVRTNASGVLEWQQAIGGSDVSEPVGMLLKGDDGYLVAGTTMAQDGDIGRHIPVRTGFLAWLGPNGNLLRTALTTETEECTLLALDEAGGIAYLLGTVQTAGAGGTVRSVWISRLAEEGFGAQ